MPETPVRHGNETEEHFQAKGFCGAWLRAQGFSLVVYEAGADVVGFKHSPTGIQQVCIEVERSAKNVLQNIRRNFFAGATSVVVVALSKNHARNFHDLVNTLPKPLQDRIAVVQLKDLNNLEFNGLTYRNPQQKKENNETNHDCQR